MIIQNVQNVHAWQAMKYSPKQIASLVGFSESSLKRWIDSGKLAVERSPGGHRRITRPEIVRFIRRHNIRISDPSLLGLPTSPSPITPDTPQDLPNVLVEMFKQGNTTQAKNTIINAFLNGASMPMLFDTIIKETLAILGEMWDSEHGEAIQGIALEHLATETCIRASSEILALIPKPASTSQVAVGMAPQGDPYILPGFAATTALCELGYNVFNLGPNTPAAAFETIAREQRCRLGFISIANEPTATVKQELRRLIHVVSDMDALLFVGGRSHSSVFPGSCQTVICGDSIAELYAFARGLDITKTSTKQTEN
jgi:excisionase family DNA binding protein